MVDRPHLGLVPLAACDLPLDHLLDDYVRHANLQREALDSFKAALGAGRLQGWVAVANGQAAGLVAFAPRDTWAQIDLVHAPGSPALVQALVARAVHELGRSKDLTSIVANVHRPTDSVRDAFLGQGCLEIERQEMVLDLTQPLPSAPSPPGYVLVSWQSRFRAAAAEVMWRANRDRPDALIYPPLQTLEECRDLVAKIATGRWGRFLPRASPVALDDRGNVVALLLAGRIAYGKGYVFEVAVLPACQGVGLGKALVVGCLAECQAAGLSEVGLSVSLHNAPAMGLYQALGFRRVSCYSAFVWLREAASGEGGTPGLSLAQGGWPGP